MNEEFLISTKIRIYIYDIFKYNSYNKYNNIMGELDSLGII